MASLHDVDEFGKLILIVLAIIFGLPLLKKISGGVSDIAGHLGLTGTIGESPTFGGSAPPSTLTAVQARAISIALTGDPSDYTLSPDGTQVWFYSGAYYDAPSTHVYDASGNDLGALTASNASDIGARMNPAAPLPPEFFLQGGA
jgi:hypothetical protein